MSMLKIIYQEINKLMTKLRLLDDFERDYYERLALACNLHWSPGV